MNYDNKTYSMEGEWEVNGVTDVTKQLQAVVEELVDRVSTLEEVLNEAMYGPEE